MVADFELSKHLKKLMNFNLTTLVSCLLFFLSHSARKWWITRKA